MQSIMVFVEDKAGAAADQGFLRYTDNNVKPL